jgi:hypothetical protein
VLEVEKMHPELAATAARLFDQGHYREAVLRAARIVNELTQDRVGIEVAGLEGVSLVQQAWSTSDSEPGRPRLRVPGVDRVTEERMWNDLHIGALHFGQGLYMRVRNVVEHGRDEFNEAVAAEMLAGFSLYARWVTDAQVEGA